MIGKSGFPDGARVLDPVADKLWLVFEGRGHHVTSPDVYDKLFRQGVEIVKLNGQAANGIRPGDDLIFGSNIVRGDAKITTYFLAVHLKKVRLHPIPSIEIFEKYGFDMSLCRQVPESMLSRFAKGRPLR